MPEYIYRAKDRNSQDVTGTVEANDRKTAVSILKSKGLFVYRIEENRSSNVGEMLKGLRRPSLVDIANFTRQLATMVNAGLPLSESLTMLKDQGKPAVREIVSGILRDVEGGSSLANSLQKYPLTFSPVYVAIVRAGESAGVLDQLLLRLADNLDSQREFRAKLKGALIYPAIIVIGMIIVVTIMMIFVIPKLTSIYSEFDAKLPTPTRVIISISDYAAKFWWLVFIIIGAGFYLYKFVYKIPEWRLKIESFKFKLPIAGKLIMKVILAEMTRTLSLLVGAGVPLLDALGTSSKVGNNKIIEDAFTTVSKKVEKGYSLAAAVAETGLFPTLMSQMLSVGEETGKLDEVLMKVSKYFQSESEEALKGLTSAIEPLIMIILGVGVGFLVIAIILPIYSLTSQF